MHARKVINIIGLFSTHQYKQTFKEKTVQQPSERDTVTGRRQDAFKYILRNIEFMFPVSVR